MDRTLKEYILRRLCMILKNKNVSLTVFTLGPLYPSLQPRQVPSTMSQLLSWEFCGHGKEQFSPGPEHP